MNYNDPLFKKYVAHVLKWEGLTSDDPDDTASSCAPYSGAIHTNKGVTYCTFRNYAEGLGVLPVTYDRFLHLTNDDIAKFVWLFSEGAKASNLTPSIALSVTEAAWGSGPERAVMHLQTALNQMGANLEVDGVKGPQTEAAVQRANKKQLYDLFWKERIRFLEYLIAHGYEKFAYGWRARVQDFLKNFPYSATFGAIGILAIIILLFHKPLGI